MTPEQPRIPQVRPWWREPMMWLVVGAPATVVVAALVTVYIAVRAPDPVIDRDYYQRGLERSLPAEESSMRPAREARNHVATPPAASKP